jgi:hypothetical protein
MRRTLDLRLGRVTGATVPRDLTVLRRRMLLRARAAVSTLLRQGSGRAEPGRALAGALAFGAMAMAELAAIPDGADLRRWDESGLAGDHPGVEDAFTVRVQSMAQQYRAGREVDPTNASPAELLGACLAGPPAFPPLQALQGGEG